MDTDCGNQDTLETAPSCASAGAPLQVGLRVGKHEVVFGRRFSNGDEDKEASFECQWLSPHARN